MKHSLIILSILLCGYTIAHPYGGSSCYCSDGGSSCCRGSSCCAGGGSSCCSRGRSSCYSGGGTSYCSGGDSSCCCGGVSCCCSGGGPPCSPVEKCYHPITPPPTPTPSTPTPSTPTLTTPSRPPSPQPGTPYNSSVSNNNNITIPTNISIQNDVHSQTYVHVPVSILVNNQNDIQIKSDSNQETINCCDKDCKKDEQPCTNNTKVVTVTVTVPVTVRTPYPVPVPIPQPYMVTVPAPQPVPTGCCTMVAPCMPYTHRGCMQNSLHCGGQCSGSVMYQPSNLCQSGCLQVPSSYGVQCGMSGCNRTPVDCSMCNENWGQTYDMFKMCSGCFLPMPWGGRSGAGYYGK